MSYIVEYYYLASGMEGKADHTKQSFPFANTPEEAVSEYLKPILQDSYREDRLRAASWCLGAITVYDMSENVVSFDQDKVLQLV